MLIVLAYDMALIGVANKVSKMIFDGTYWLHYNFSQMKDFSRWRNVSLQSLRLTFETRNLDGVIWFTETSDHYMTFGIGVLKLSFFQCLIVFHCFTVEMISLSFIFVFGEEILL